MSARMDGKDERSPGAGATLPTSVAVAVLVAANVLTWWSSLGGAFVFDDLHAIVHNEELRRLWPGPAKPGETLAGRPVVALTLSINYAIGGLDPTGYHVVNVAVHVLAALALFGLVRRTLRDTEASRRFGAAATPLALASALLWSLHPLQAECINYVIQRSESLMALFFLLTLYAVARRATAPGPGPWGVRAVVAAAIGMACKETMALAPLAALAWDRAFVAGSFGAALRRRRALYAGLGLSWLVLVALNAGAPRGTSVAWTADLGPLGYAAAQGLIVARYLRLVIWPDPLVIDYGVAVAPDWAEAAPWVAILLLLAAGALVLAARRPGVGFLPLMFFLTLAPTSSFVPILTEVGAERRMYLPLAALVTLGVLAVWRGLAAVGRPGARRERLAVAGLATAVLAVALSLRSQARNLDYRDPEILWRGALAAFPENPRAHNSLGATLATRGRYAEAIVHFREALRLQPDYPQAEHNLKLALEHDGRRPGGSP